MAIRAEVAVTAAIRGGRVQGGRHDGGIPRGAIGAGLPRERDRDGAGTLFARAYFGTNVHPYETVFFRANRGIDPRTLCLLVAWHQSGHMGNGSWEA
ncbi:hypothetical protein DL771_000177 [Monosporascus sp. 5C6A]|nr:hypothetical protein DL771_000177 [Monosporascus sp. 5C6A]